MATPRLQHTIAPAHAWRVHVGWMLVALIAIFVLLMLIPRRTGPSQTPAPAPAAQTPLMAPGP